MRLTDLFSGGQVNNAATAVPQTGSAANAGAALANRQIQALTPGQTIQGEVVSRNGNEVQIKVADDLVLNARVDQNMQLEVGKTMTFEVRNNGQSLTLSPLFANTATDANVLKALNMASMPVNQTTVSLTGLMMEAGLSIDRNTLQQMFREVNAFRGADVSDIVDLHKLGLPVNEENLTQIASYKNLTHQLVEGMNTVLDALPESMQNMLQEGNVDGAARMLQDLLELVRELPAETQSAEDAAQGGQVQSAEADAAGVVREGNGTTQGTGSAAGLSENMQNDGAGAVNTFAAETAERIADGNTEALLQMVDGKSGSAAGDIGSIAGGVPDSLQGAVLADAEAVITELGNGAESAALIAENSAATERSNTLTRELRQLIQANGGDAEHYETMLRQLETAEQSGNTAEQAGVLHRLIQQGLDDKNPALLRGMISNRSVQNMIAGGLSKLWTIEPGDVADRGKVEELYQRLDRQLKSLTHMLERGGQTDSTAYKAVSNMTQNLDFLQQLNQAYTYVQLPLRLQQGDAHGDLYVYTNKRNLAAKDGQISALLHLDMEHLGPVDVYVAMQAEKVNTRFYVQDDAMLDFLESHMDLLTERLQKRGYNCSFAMQVRNQGEEPESGLNGLTAHEKGHVIAQYAFDVRA